MTKLSNTFAVASDDALVALIRGARHRLVVVAPALTRRVADALAQRLEDLGDVAVTVILDSDPEVYRLGFGDQDALDVIRTASAVNLFDLREQPGVRIGIVIADGRTMVYAPVSKTIEAGSTSRERPNAIVLTGTASDQLASAAGADTSDRAPTPEVGNEALKPAKVQAMLADLQANPVMPFDLTRTLKVFSSKIQFVEFSASNYRLTNRQITLPPELMDVNDDDLKTRITSRIRVPTEGIGKLDVSIQQNGGTEKLKVDDDWLTKERQRFQDAYTFQVNNYGRVIFYRDRKAFEKKAERFTLIVAAYQVALAAKLATLQAEFEERLVEEFTGKWEQNPPKEYVRWGIEATPERMRADLQRLAKGILAAAVAFDPPTVKILYKNVAPENVRDAAFISALKAVFVKKKVPLEIFGQLFDSGWAAPQTGTLNGTLAPS